MNFIALKMLTGDRAKYLGLIFAIAFATFLLENQTSRTERSQGHHRRYLRRLRSVRELAGDANPIQRGSELCWSRAHTAFLRARAATRRRQRQVFVRSD